MQSREQDIRTWSMLCHLSALAGLLFTFGNLIGPFIVWQIKKNELPEIDAHGKASLNFQLNVTIITIILSVFLFGALGFGALMGSPFTMLGGGLGLGFVLFAIRLVSWILVIVASIRANNGELFRYPGVRIL
jgi:uncharacterized protein